MRQPLDDDALYLIYARHYDRILLTCDDLTRGGRLTSAMTGYRIGAEIRQRGGAVITVGRTDQPVDRMLGKLLFYREHWERFFAEGAGKVTIGKVGGVRHCNTCGLAVEEVPGDYRARRPHQLSQMEEIETSQGQRYLEAMKALGLRKRPATGRPFEKKRVGVTLSLGGEFDPV